MRDAGNASGAIRDGTGDNRAFALTLAAGFVVLGLIALYRERRAAAVILLVLSAALVLSGFLIPSRLGRVRKIWMGIGELIGRVTTPVLMGVLYYLVITPAGMLRRLGARSKPTGWRRRSPLPPPSRMERQF